MFIRKLSLSNRLRAIISLLLVGLVAASAGYRTLHAQTSVKLTLPPTTAVIATTAVNLPVTLDAAGQHVSGVLFSIDYDQRCLAFEGADNNGDGLPDGFQPLTPPQFSVSASFDATDDVGEFDVIILDFSLPFAALPAGPLAILHFTTICTPDYAGILRAPVEFSSRPQPSFSSPLGRNIDGVAIGGIVEIVDGAAPPTATPTFTPTPSPSPTPTATHTPTATPEHAPTFTPTPVTPTATPTPLGGQVKPPIPPTPTPTATPTVTATPTATATPTLTPLPSPPPAKAPGGQNASELFLPLIQNQ
ncbi:MAG: hypothetical protein IPM07_22630 [Anaerolineales bacterium]|nr:hypothetical protein [Anaerolineales bacterium]